MLSPKSSPLGQQLSQYVCLRITRMDNVDIGLFEHDRNNAIYFYMLNADEQIYMRYGGRDSASPDTYLNLESLELAARQGLELHRQYMDGKLAKFARPPAAFPRQIPMLVERTFAQNQCVECHLIADYQNQHREQDGTLDKLRHLYRSPDIKTIGIHLDVPRGLAVKEAAGAAVAAGLKAGDVISAVDGRAVWTFADLQHNYDKVDRRAKQVRITVLREGKAVDLTFDLPQRWWWTDLRFRQASVDPRLYFEDKPLTDAQRTELQLPAGGLASEVKYVAEFARTMKSHALEVGDIIVAVDGVERDEFAHTAELYLKLKKTPGDSARLTVLRNGKRLEMDLKTFRMSFRK
ncbi:MAG: PDZ domain-containing protein [Acidobacteria bacterium]|nr:PDZ domain-containing protein [Acidobacteriota bacterium]